MTAETSQNLEPSQRPLLELISLAAPTVAQSVSYTVMMFIDTWMLSRLGADEFTAAGNAGMFGFSIICFGFGVLLVVNTLVSQSFGRGEYSACGRYLWQGIWVAIGYWLLVLALLPVAGRVFPLLGHPPRLAELEGTYLRIVLGATVFKMIGTALGQFLLATNRPNSVMASAAIGVSINALIAYAIVLGRWGAPQLGVVGAAWAQNVGTFVEMAVLVVFAFSHQRTRFNGRFENCRKRHERFVVVPVRKNDDRSPFTARICRPVRRRDRHPVRNGRRIARLDGNAADRRPPRTAHPLVDGHLCHAAFRADHHVPIEAGVEGASQQVQHE